MGDIKSLGLLNIVEHLVAKKPDVSPQELVGGVNIGLIFVRWPEAKLQMNANAVLFLLNG